MNQFNLSMRYAAVIIHPPMIPFPLPFQEIDFEPYMIEEEFILKWTKEAMINAVMDEKMLE